MIIGKYISTVNGFILPWRDKPQAMEKQDTISLWAILLVLFTSCGSPNDKKQNDSNFELVKEAPSSDTLISEDSKNAVFYATLEVDDFDTWLKNFNAIEKVMLSKIFSEVKAHQSMDEENQIILIGRSENHDASRDYFRNSAYQVNFLDLKWGSENTPNTDQAIFVKHGVGDYISWLDKFKSKEETRRQNGLYTIGVARDSDDPTKITIYFAVDDIEKAQAYINPELIRAMEASGVDGKPEGIPVKVLKTLG